MFILAFQHLKITDMKLHEFQLEEYTNEDGFHEVVALYYYHIGQKSSDPHLVPHDEDEVEVYDVVVRVPNQRQVSIGWSDLYHFLLDKSDLEIDIWDHHQTKI